MTKETLQINGLKVNQSVSDGVIMVSDFERN